MIDGDLIRIQHRTFIIADGCAGLAHLMSGLSVGALYAQGFLQHWPSRVAVLGLSAIVPIIGNLVRVAPLVALGEYTRMESIFVTQSRPRLWFGWESSSSVC